MDPELRSARRGNALRVPFLTRNNSLSMYTREGETHPRSAGEVQLS